MKRGWWIFVCKTIKLHTLQSKNVFLRQSEEWLQQALKVSRSRTFEWLPATDRVIAAPAAS